MGSEKSYRLTRLRRHMMWRRYLKILSVLCVANWVVFYVLQPWWEVGNWAFHVTQLLVVPTGLLIVAGIVVYARTRAPLPPKWQPRQPR